MGMLKKDEENKLEASHSPCVLAFVGARNLLDGSCLGSVSEEVLPGHVPALEVHTHHLT